MTTWKAQWTRVVSVLGGFLLAAAAWAQPANLDFEGDEVGAVPRGWFVPTAGYEATVQKETSGAGERSLQLRRAGEGAGFGNVMQAFDAAAFRGKIVRFSADVRVVAGGGARAQMWLRVDRDAGMGFFDNMGDRPIAAGDWKRYSIEGAIEDDAAQLNIGVMLLGAAAGDAVSIDNITFEVVGAAADAALLNEPPLALTDPQVDRLVSVARAVGLVRYFHPSDGAAAADWDAITTELVRAAIDSPSAGHLRDVMRVSFEPVAPMVLLSDTPLAAAFSAADLVPAGTKAEGYTAWEHTGIASGQHPLYGSRRLRWEAGADLEDVPPPGEAVVEALPAGVFITVPVVLATEKGKTIVGRRNSEPLDVMVAAPRVAGQNGWRPSGNDRSTRLAAVISAWNVLEHSFPYFDDSDVTREDWRRQLPVSLREAAAAKSADEFTEVLARLGAALKDGHVFVGGPGEDRPWSIPFALCWTGEHDADLTIEAVLDEAAAGAVGGAGGAGGAGGLRAGDVIRSIDGVSVEQAYAEVGRGISAATEQWKRYRALAQIGVVGGAMDRHLRIVAVHPDGTPVEAEVGLISVDRRQAWHAHRPEQGGGVDGLAGAGGVPGGAVGGLVYYDMNGASTPDFEKHLPAMLGAKGVIFDMRGYPGDGAVPLLQHLARRPFTSAQWNIPRITLPDGRGMEFEQSNWSLLPLEPRIEARVVFIIDGRAISYAESIMGIVEAEGFGPIVGEPTAGTNGNVNVIRLVMGGGGGGGGGGRGGGGGGGGGYSMSFTGMKVLKHDGSRHHGVGIAPTKRVHRTAEGVAAGRDELLEAAVSILAPPSP